MKYLVLLAVLLLAFGIWRSGRRRPPARRPPAAAPEAAAQDMLACSVCGVHLPQADIVTGQLGHYCSDAHRRSAEP